VFAVTWPIGMGRDLLGVYHLLRTGFTSTFPWKKGRVGSHETIDGLASGEAKEFLGRAYGEFLDEVDLVRGASPEFDLAR